MRNVNIRARHTSKTIAERKNKSPQTSPGRFVRRLDQQGGGGGWSSGQRLSPNLFLRLSRSIFNYTVLLLTILRVLFAYYSLHLKTNNIAYSVLHNSGSALEAGVKIITVIPITGKFRYLAPFTFFPKIRRGAWVYDTLTPPR